MIKNREPDRINANGTKYWYDENGLSHNDNGYSAIVYNNGTKFWCKHGIFHNENGPAIIWANGIKYWYIDGKQLIKPDFKQFKIKQFIDE